MPKSTPENIVDVILNHTDGLEIRKLAHEITNIVASVRRACIFKEILDDEIVDPKTLENLDELIKDFKEKIDLLLQINITGTDSDIYDQVIYPLVMKQLDRSA